MRSDGFRAFPLDGQLLLFDRATGENQLWTGEETAHLRQRAPRVLQVAITNACNKECAFCYRPLESASRWTKASLLELARFADRWGVLELAFGGGEPTVFRGFPALVASIVAETGLSVSFTTNGSRLGPELLAELAGRIGQVQLSVYDEDDYGAVIDRLVRHRVRFGLNYLVTPARLRSLEVDVAAFVARGVRDILFLSYKGHDRALHLGPAQQARFDEATEKVARLFRGRLDVKVDVCWGHRLERTPQLFGGPDCGAGSLFLSLTSDRKVLACSFADGGEPFENVEELPAIWTRLRALRPAAPKPGCARLPGFGLTKLRRRALPVVSVETGA